MTILDEILSHKKAEVAHSKEKSPVSKLERSRLFAYHTLPLTEYIVNPEKSGIIAEYKRRSPSAGVINDQSTIEEVTTGYFRSGASGLSVLTDARFFGGSLADLIRTRQLNPIPILRKDFIIDEYQITEAKSCGADAILLIAAANTIKQTRDLARHAHTLNLQVLLEIHNESELDYVNEFIDIIGVNNRDLKTFKVDVDISVQLADKLPAGMVKISESGISSALVLKKLRGCGYQGFLIGESFMRTPEPTRAFSVFVENIIMAR
jgi:indole-3-glycerol phosphate synthase